MSPARIARLPEFCLRRKGFVNNTDKIAKYAKKVIVAVCDAGVTSSKVVDSLRKTGLENVNGLKGGINAWTQANLARGEGEGIVTMLSVPMVSRNKVVGVLRLYASEERRFPGEELDFVRTRRARFRLSRGGPPLPGRGRPLRGRPARQQD